MPFSTPAFISMLAEAAQGLAEYGIPGNSGDIRFLEVGCGPGPKMLIARDLFGMDVRGIDRSDEYTAAARSIGLNASTCDALSYGCYNWAHVTWFNRVARDADIEADIEAVVWRGMMPGSVVMCANLENRPPAPWLPVLDDWEVRRGIWRKPDSQPAAW
jgi:trans-aconitate methyltransferase